MQKITQILEAKNIVIYNDGCIKSIDNSEDFLLKFNINNCNSNLKLILDEDYVNNFNFSVYKNYINGDAFITTICIEGDSTQSFAICGVK